MKNKELIKEVRKVWKRTKKKDGECGDEVEQVIKASDLSDYQRGYLNAKLDEIGNCLSDRQEDWLWEVEKVLGYL